MDNDTVRSYSAKIEEVHSADDYMLMVNLGVDGLYKRVRARLYGVDTPNAYKAASNSLAIALRDECKQLFAGRCYVEVVNEGKGGWVVKMYTHTHSDSRVCVNEIMRERGYVYTPVRRGVV